jgi:hypothetical protein
MARFAEGPGTRGTPSMKKQHEVSFFAVAFLDVLGMRDAFRNLDFDPTISEPNMNAIQNAVKNTVNVMEKFREIYKEFESGSDEQMPPPLSAAVPPEARIALEKWRKPIVKHLQVGDAIMPYVSLAEGPQHSPVRGLYNLVLAAGSLSLFQLALKHPIRGGLDIGLGVEHPQAGLYSSAQVKAYELETHAGHPRILVGDSVTKYLDWVKGRPETSWEYKLDANLAPQIGALFCKDPSDGKLIIDYLGKSFRDQTSSHETARPLIKEAREFVGSQVEFWEQDKNEKLHARYKTLADYFDKRMYLWRSPG